jgi:hypothetical protein
MNFHPPGISIMFCPGVDENAASYLYMPKNT